MNVHNSIWSAGHRHGALAVSSRAYRTFTIRQFCILTSSPLHRLKVNSHEDSWKQYRHLSTNVPNPKTSGQLVLCKTDNLLDGLGKIATITLNRRARANALNSALLDQLLETIQSVSRNENIRFIVLSGSEPHPHVDYAQLDIRNVSESVQQKVMRTKMAHPTSQRGEPRPVFCAGADVSEMGAMSTSAEARAFIQRIHYVCKAIRESTAIVIARIDGPCIGAGVEIAAACDFRVATITSSFGMPEVKVGIPSVIEARLLVNLMGWQATRRILYSGATWDAEYFHKAGFLDHMSHNAVSMDIELISRFLMPFVRNSLKAMKVQKSLIKTWEDEIHLRDSIEAGISAFEGMWSDGGTEPRKYMGMKAGFIMPKSSETSGTKKIKKKTKKAQDHNDDAPLNEPQFWSKMEGNTSMYEIGIPTEGQDITEERRKEE